MKRINIKQAFVGEPNPDQEGIAAEASDEQVQYEVKSGTFSLVVHSDVPDDQVFSNYGTISGELLLDDGTTVSFEIPDGVDGVTFMFNGAGVQNEPDMGMSTATASQTATPATDNAQIASDATEMGGGVNTASGELPANQGG